MGRIVVVGSDSGYGAAIADGIATGLGIEPLRIPASDGFAPERAMGILKGADRVVYAGLSVHRAAFLDLDPEVFEASIRTNVGLAFRWSQAAGRAMRDGGRPGRILLLSSTGSRLGTPGLDAYNASKGAISAMVRSASLSLAPHGITINALAPGTIDIGATQRRLAGSEEARREMAFRTPLGRAGMACEIGAAAVFLLGPDSSYITGQTLFVDGGRSGLE